ncbi:MAG: amidohydrolase family protein, partial [Candidatus Riflebacteria bacterium]|nr:amidohydrolase family protein [Candidatus Riflebacteria bacterium]
MEKGYIFYQGKFQELDKLVIEKGKISEVIIASTKAKKGKAAPASKKKNEEISETIDCTGKYIVPGFIDPHTHISLDQSGIGHFDSDSNEMFGLVTPQIRAYDAVKMRDIASQNALKGGVTTVMITPGSAN